MLFQNNCLKKYIFIFFGFCCHWLCAQTVRQPLTGTYTGPGAYSKNSADAFSFVINPAALSNISSGTAGVYAERRFLLAALTQYTATAAFKTSSGNFGLQADYFGYTNYHESQIGVAYARPLGKKVDIGAKFNYYNLRIPAYTKASAVYFEAGMMMHLTAKLHAGISVFNPAGGTLNKTTGEKIASVYRGGIGYEASDKFFISAEIIKEEGKNAGVNAALQYLPVKQLVLRAGINTVSTQPYAGAGIKFGQFRIDVAAIYHQQLGVSPAVMMLFDFQHKHEEE